MNTPTLPADVDRRFRPQLTRCAYAVAHRRIVAGWSSRDLSHLRHEFADTATGAAHEWIAATADSAATVEQLATLAPREWPQDLYRAAFRAVERLVYPLARFADGPTAYLRIGDETLRHPVESPDLFATPDEKLSTIAATCDELRERVRVELLTANNGGRGYVRDLLALIDRVEAYARACVRAERDPLRVPVALSDPKRKTVTLARLVNGPDAASRLRAAFAGRLDRFAARVLRDRRRKGTLTHEDDMHETAESARCNP